MWLIWSLSDHFKEILWLGWLETCKLLPKFGIILYSTSLNVPYPILMGKFHATVLIIRALPNMTMFRTGVGWAGWHCQSWLEKKNTHQLLRKETVQHSIQMKLSSGSSFNPLCVMSCGVHTTLQEGAFASLVTLLLKQRVVICATSTTGYI